MLTRYDPAQSALSLSIEQANDEFAAARLALSELSLAKPQRSFVPDLRSTEISLQPFGHALPALNRLHQERRERSIKLLVPLLTVCCPEKLFSMVSKAI
jgi:hypothetical protein